MTLPLLLLALAPSHPRDASAIRKETGRRDPCGPLIIVGTDGSATGPASKIGLEIETQIYWPLLTTMQPQTAG
eukprot:SAG22_NODE_3984_length_1437_cov_1.175635_2_plen_73_part_00